MTLQMTAPTPRHRLTLLPEGRSTEAGADETLLQAGLRAGFPLASSCRNGTCRECRLRLVEGRIAYRIEWPGLSPEEKRDGWVLPCVAEPRADVVLAPLGD